MTTETKRRLRVLLCTFVGALAGPFVGCVFLLFSPTILKVGVTLMVAVVGYLIGIALYR